METQFKTGLMLDLQRQKDKDLGDRSTYIGASDVGQCPRKAVLQKQEEISLSVEQMIIFKRGHLAEEIVAAGFSAYNPERQHEISFKTENGTPIKVHIDFLFGKEAVMEVKSTDSIPDVPYSSWELQIQLQMGALKFIENRQNVRGRIFVLNVNTGEQKIFPVEFDEAMYNIALKKADKIWAMHMGEMDMEMSVSPICGYCPFLKTCPQFVDDVVEAPELEEEAESIFNLEKQIKKLNSEVKSKKSSIKKLETPKIKAGNFFIEVQSRNRTNTDVKKICEDYGVKDLSPYQSTTSFEVMSIKEVKK